MGPTASGACANGAASAARASPALRMAAARELLKVPRALGPIGFPATMNADVSPGFPCMAYQGAAVATTLRKAKTFALIRFARTTSRPQAACRQDIAQRASAGCCPHCAQATHVALPPSSTLGDFNWSKSRGSASWKSHGRWDAGRPAASYFACTHGQPPKAWGWERRSLNMTTSTPWSPDSLDESSTCA